MEDLYTANAVEIGKDLIGRGTRTYITADRNLPIITGLQKMKFDSGLSLDVNKELEAKDQEIEKLKLDVERCSEQVYQVMRMNTNWQRYNDQREVKDQEKERERTVMIQQIKYLKEHVAMSEQKIMDMKSVYKSMSEDSVLRAENNELRKQLEIKELENRRLKAEMQRNHSEEDKTRIEFLQHQVNVYVEDFRKEREDREAIQAKYDSTRTELLEAQRTIDRLTTIYKQDGASYPYVTRARQDKAFDVGMQPLGVEFHRQATDRYNASGLSDEVEVDCEDNVDDDSLLNAKKEEKLKCPACFKEFSFKEHHLLVEHIDACS